MNTNPGIYLLLVLLLCASALLSSSETALFSLSRADRKSAGGRVRKLLAEPRDLLVSILMFNLVVNLLYFGFAGRLVDGGPKERLLAGAGALLMLLIFGEILPKTLALRAPLVVARATSVPLGALVVLLRPLRRFFHAVLEACLRVLGSAGRQEHGLTQELLEEVLVASAEEGLLETGEADLLAEIVELEGIRVREIMTPRVDAIFYDLAASDPRLAVQQAMGEMHSWLPVIDGNPDEVLGSVRMRDLLVNPDLDVRRSMIPMLFVPEVADAMALLHSLRRDKRSKAVVVDEWGGTAGVVTLEDVFEELVGDLRVEGEERPKAVIPLGEGRYRVAGSLSVRDWNERFGLRIVPTAFETVGGFVTALLGRIPRTGDQVQSGRLVCAVHEVRGRRVLSVDMFVATPDEEGAA